MEFLTDYGLFAAKTITLLVAFAIAVAIIAATAARGRPRQERERLEVEPLNERYRRLENTLRRRLGGKRDAKLLHKAEKAERKQRSKSGSERPRVYVLDFDGDLRASAVDHLREEVSSVLGVVRDNDEVVVRLESPGGVVPSYGLAASQLARIRDRGVRLTVSVDKVAASGGYLMASVADTILAAPFAIVGSIGVVAQLPNFHRFLKRHDVDYELHTAGEFKRTVTLFGENTEEGRKKLRDELEDTHALFKDHLRRYRPHLDVDRVATGEYWLGEKAKELGLVDELQTSDDYLLERAREADLFRVHYEIRRPLSKRLALSFESLLERAGLR